MDISPFLSEIKAETILFIYFFFAACFSVVVDASALVSHPIHFLQPCSTVFTCV